MFTRTFGFCLFAVGILIDLFIVNSRVAMAQPARFSKIVRVCQGKTSWWAEGKRPGGARENGQSKIVERCDSGGWRAAATAARGEMSLPCSAQFGSSGF